MDLSRLAPSRTVVVTRWRNDGSLWRTRPLTFAILIAGLWLFGTGEAFLVQAGIGTSPWTVFAQGVANHTGIGIGFATAAISVLVMLVWIPLKVRPGLGTACNLVLVASSLGIMVLVLPAAHALGWQLAEAVLGIASIGAASGLYLTANLGPGPRDGMMTGIHQRTGWPVTGARLSIEVAVVATGWLLGGTVGLGTLMFALLVGPSVGYGLRAAGRIGRLPGARTTRASPDWPELEA